MFVLFSLSIFFLLCSMGQVDGNKTDDEWNLRRGAHLLSQAIEPVGGYTTESVTHGQWDTRPTVTFPAAEHHRPLTGTKLYCLVNRGTCVWTTCPESLWILLNCYFNCAWTKLSYKLSLLCPLFAIFSFSSSVKNVVFSKASNVGFIFKMNFCRFPFQLLIFCSVRIWHSEGATSILFPARIDILKKLVTAHNYFAVIIDLTISDDGRRCVRGRFAWCGAGCLSRWIPARNYYHQQVRVSICVRQKLMCN